MSTNKKGRSVSAPKKDRTGLCAFTFADGRQCRTPRRAGHTHFCFYHARKEAQSLAAENVGKDISSLLSGDFLLACDLSLALARLFSAVAKGDIKPRTASTLAYLGQTMLQSMQMAQHEYCEAFETNTWRHAVRSSFDPPPPAPPKPTRRPEPLPRTAAEFVDRIFSMSSSQPAQPAPPSPPPHPTSAHHPAARVVAGLKTGNPPSPAPQPTSAHYPAAPPVPADHVVAGPNLSRPGRETGDPSCSTPADNVVAGLKTGNPSSPAPQSPPNLAKPDVQIPQCSASAPSASRFAHRDPDPVGACGDSACPPQPASTHQPISAPQPLAPHPSPSAPVPQTTDNFTSLLRIRRGRLRRIPMT